MRCPRKISFIALLSVIVGLLGNDLVVTQAQRSPASETSPSAPAQKVQAVVEPDNSNEAFVIERYKTLYRYEKDGTGAREMNIRVKIQSDAGVEQFGQLVFPYSSANEKLEFDFIRVLKADGTAIDASAADVQDLSAPVAREAPIYTDLRQKHVTVRGLRPGDVLEYHTVSTLHTPLAGRQFWLSHDFLTKELIVLDEQLEINIPRDSNVKLKTKEGLVPTIKDQNERRVYTWKGSNLKRPEKDEEKERKKLEESDGPEPPEVQMTTFQSWDEVGKWYAGLERDRIVPDEKIKLKAEELLSGQKTDKEKIEALYQFVARNFRYVSLSLGQGRYQPHAASEVMANQYGDCKDKHTLLTSMLQAVGLRAYPALMNSSRKIDPDMPSPAQFDHVITAIPLGTEMLWADTTAEVAPFQLLSPPLRDKKALLIPTNALARLETTPADPPFLSTEVLEVDGQVNDLGRLSGRSHLTVRGDSEMPFRMMFRRTPRSNWKELGYYLTMVAGVEGEASDIKPTDPAAFEKPFEVEYAFSNDSFLDWSSKKLKLKIPLPTLNLAYLRGDGVEITKPIKLGSPIDVSYRLKVTLPSKYQTRLPLPLKVTRDYADYSSTYKLDGNTLLVERKFRLRQSELPADRAEDYRAFVASARADEAQTLSLETDVTGSPTIPETVKVEDLIKAAEAAAKNENYPVAEDLLKRVLEKEPKHKSVRRQLGWALYLQRKFDPAVEVLREQTKINAFDNYSYNLLGRIFWQQQKYGEAETAFRKQIEVTPLDKFAHGNLGQMLVEWRKFKEAVPELEQAIALSPEEEFLHVSLGRAYLNLDQTEKAIESFDRAVKLAPGPPVWNDISYFLSVKKVQLEKAQQYAESAVTAIATELRNVELSRLTRDDLSDVGRISAYWDTLGWVHFQNGNLDLAERYVSAAWSLGQHSEVGYHLGQIQEKRGKAAEAVHLYAMATVANRLVPEARDSLERMVGKEKSEAILKQATDDYRESRTISLGKSPKDFPNTTAGEFYVVLVPGSSGEARVAEVKFISGDEKLRILEGALQAASFNFRFPDERATKIIRRGSAFCQTKGGDCTFIMLSPEFITSID